MESILSTFGPAPATLADDDHSSTARNAVLAVMNGVLGDHLVASGNPLATKMTLRHCGEVLDDRVTDRIPYVTGKVLLLIHGLCLNEEHWTVRREGRLVDHGAAVAAALGYTPVYLRYNTGLHTSQNGAELSGLLERLVEQWPVPIEEIAILAHSMGGLVARSACHHAERNARRWRRHLKHMVFLGTPHHGAPLERAGNWVDQLLGGMRYTAPFAMLGKLRSAGITDLRYGHVVDEDWVGHDRFHRKADDRLIVPLPEGVQCYTIAATTAAKRRAVADLLMGDGLVPVQSALGEHNDPQRDLRFADFSRWIAYRTNHMQLLTSPGVTAQLQHWLAAPRV